jgi:hypothetical protein
LKHEPALFGFGITVLQIDGAISNAVSQDLLRPDQPEGKATVEYAGSDRIYQVIVLKSLIVSRRLVGQ